MSVPKGPHGRSSNQEFGTWAAQCVAKKLKTSPFPSFLNDLLEVSKSGKRLIGVLMIIADLLQNGAEDGMFGHPIRNSLAHAALIMVSVQQHELPCGHLVWTAHLNGHSHERGSENRVPAPSAR